MGMKEIFAANLRALMDQARELGEFDLATQNGLAAQCKPKVGQKTISRILALEQVASIEIAHAVAQAYGLQGWQLLVPPPFFKPANPPVLQGMTPTEEEMYRALREVGRAVRAVEREKNVSHPGKGRAVSRPADSNSDKPRAKSRPKVQRVVK